MSKFQFSPGRVLVQDVFIRKPDGTEADITPVVAEININSSILDISTKITFTISDDVAFINNFSPEAGDEIELVASWGDAPVSIKSIVIQIGGIVNGESGRVYNIECGSKLLFNSMKSKISRSFTGPPSEMAKSIYTEFTEEKINQWETSVQARKFVMPYMRATQAIEFLAGESLSNSDSTIAYFFQDSRMNYNFTSLETLIKNQEKDDHLRFVYNASTLGLNTTAKARNIISLSYNKVSDFITQTNNCSNMSTEFLANLNEKNFSTVTHGHWRDFDESVHLNKNPLHTQIEMEKTAQFEYSYYASGSHSGLQLNTFTDKTELKKTILRTTHSIDIVVNSNEVVEVGMVVEIVIPKPAPHVNGDDGIDNYWSGKYLVVAKREMLKNDEGKIALALVKDSKK